MAQKTLTGMFLARAVKSADREAVRFKHGAEWRSFTFGQLHREVRRLALGLLSLGVAAGDRIAILSENRPEWVLADLAVLSVAAVDVPIYATSSPAQVAFIVKNSGAKLLFVSTRAQLEKALAVRQEVASLAVIAFDKPAIDAPSAIGLDTLQRQGDAHDDTLTLELEHRLSSIAKDDVATIIYTSGTTGDPKGVQLTHGNIYENATAGLEVLPFREDDIFLSVLPLSHSFERTGGYYAPVMRGATIAYAESLDRFAVNVEEVRPTVMCVVPRLLEKMRARILDNVAKATGVRGTLGRWAMQVGAAYGRAARGDGAGAALRTKRLLADRLVFARIRDKLGGRLRFLISGGSPLAREIAEFYHSLGVLVLEGYGLTETAPVLAVNSPDAFKFGTVGRPLRNVELKIAEDGEVLAKGPNVMPGYFRNEAATREAIDTLGWFHTGDIGEVDADGFLRITDRKKDLIATAGGKKVAPQNLENRFKTDPFISEFVALGEGRPYLVGLVVPNFEALRGWAREKGIADGSNEELCRRDEVKALFRERIDLLSRDLAPYETVKKLHLLPKDLTLDAGELTPTMKVKRKVIAERYGDVIEALYK